VLGSVRQHVPERLGEPATVELRRDRTALPLHLGVVPGPRRRPGERRQFHLFALGLGRLRLPGGFQSGEARPKAVELSFDGGPVMPGSRIAPECFAHKGERGGRSSKLVFGARYALPLAHSASVSL